ncbi:MAG: DUF4041 domain-containing protein [Pseudomonadota bacterium]|nr:DUF4041 domain-containing protein [Pseudomonadota bacterium]
MRELVGRSTCAPWYNRNQLEAFVYAEAFLVVAVLGLVAAIVVGAAMTMLWMRARADAARLRERFGPIVDLDAERVKVAAERDRLEAENAALSGAISQSRAALKAEIERERAQVTKEIGERRAKFEERYGAALADLDRLTGEVKLFDERAELQSFGLYAPYYDFGTSEKYKAELEKVRAKQAAMVKEGAAATCPREWTVDGDRRKGKQMTDRNLKLMLRAFNGECDAAIVKVRFNNAVAIQERIRKAFEAVNKLGEPNACSVQKGYLDLKLAELRLAHEYAEKVQAEKEEQREIRERLRDEEAAQREFERARLDAEKEERRYAQALEKAKMDLEAADGAKHAQMEAKVADLERKLAGAHALKERAISQAQLTKSGHVYVISNMGSFGETTYKVGMTRRLEPEERVRELGDASVPFAFDIHAVMYSDDAPALENALHRALAAKRVNMVNLRKEFFVATLDEIEAAARKHVQGDFEFVRVAVAEEYRKTLALRAEGTASVGDEVSAPLVADARVHFDEVRAALADL